MENAKGKLPSKSQLMKNGYGDLVKCMKKHPEMFAHIEQEKEPKQEKQDD